MSILPNLASLPPRKTELFKRIIKCLCFILVFVGVYVYLSNCKMQKYSICQPTAMKLEMYNDDTMVKNSKNFLPPLKSRYQLGFLLENLGMNGSGAELGVDEGIFSRVILESWHSCSKYYLIDIWNESYGNEKYQKTMEKIKKWRNKIIIRKMKGIEAAKTIANQSLDFVYIDAMHDYCSVKEDIRSYWPKVKPGGIMAGHDYIREKDIENTIGGKFIKFLGYKYDWKFCSNGQVHEGGIPAAVQQFAMQHDLTVMITYENEYHPLFPIGSWIIRKPIHP